MSIRHRPMQPQDVQECLQIVAAHPFVGPRYGDAIPDLGSAWLHLLASDRYCSTSIIEDAAQGAQPRIFGIGVSVFVSDDFLREMKTPPFLWIGPELAKRVARGDTSALLSEKQIQEGNSRGGLNLAIWQGFVRAEDAKRAELWSELMTVFLDQHRGFLLKEIVAQAESAEHLEGLRNTGGYLLKRNGSYGDFNGIDSRQLIQEPHVVGITRDLALKQFGTWISSIFLYQPPQFGFNKSEQRLLLLALGCGTDQELSDDLGISLSSVKKMWRSAYDRVSACLPELIPGNSADDNGNSERGKEKKQRLMGYLREHPEELRPVLRKLLRQSASPDIRS